LLFKIKLSFISWLVRCK